MGRALPSEPLKNSESGPGCCCCCCSVWMRLKSHIPIDVTAGAGGVNGRFTVSSERTFWSDSFSPQSPRRCSVAQYLRTRSYSRMTSDLSGVLKSLTHLMLNMVRADIRAFSRHFYRKRLTISTFARRKRNNNISVGTVRMFIEPSAKH